MSWDVLLLRVPSDVTSVNDLQDDFAGESLGSPEEVGAVLRKIFPTIDLTDPTWAVLVDDLYSIEFSIGEEDPCTSLMLHVRGTELVIEPIRRLCESTAWRAFDTSDGDLLDFRGDPAKGLREWLAYRARVAPDGPVRGVALPIEGKGVVFFDAAPQKIRPRSKWWQFSQRSGGLTPRVAADAPDGRADLWGRAHGRMPAPMGRRKPAPR